MITDPGVKPEIEAFDTRRLWSWFVTSAASGTLVISAMLGLPDLLPGNRDGLGAVVAAAG
ncbi:hypothetical protein [Cribrihabitans neustonicus]|uniref:hypothetical protein n=1 Tax=Cribrihabitans neustonicus TaxID=1429085 RepID=UPI003B5B4024